MDLRAIVLNVFAMSFIILALMLFLDLLNIDLNSPPPIKKLKQVLTIEGLDMNPSDDFCREKGTKFSCEDLTDKNCNKASCCVLLNGDKCVSGSADGPTFKTSKGEKVNVDYYYHQNRLYGENVEEV